MAPKTVFCPTCQRDTTVLGVRCVVCGTQVKELNAPAPLTPATLLRAHTWILIAPGWVLGALLLLFSEAVWEERWGATRTGQPVKVRDAETLILVLAISACAFAFAGPLGWLVGGRSMSSRRVQAASNASEAALGTRVIQAAALVMTYGMLFAVLKRM